MKVPTILPSVRAVVAIEARSMSKNLDDFSLDSNRFPKRIELQLPPELADWLQRTSAATGRSEAELLLELLDRGLQQF